MGVFIVPCASVQEVSLVCWSILTCNIREVVMISCVYVNWNECGESSWNITLPFSFLPWIVVLCFGKMLVKSRRTLETNGETFLMPKLSIVFPMITTTTWGYFAIRISSQTTKKEVSKSPLLRTIIPRKLLSFCDTITFVPVQSQVLRNSGTWYNRKTFPIVIVSIHCLRLTLHQKLFATHPSPQRLSESTQKSIGFRYKI